MQIRNIGFARRGMQTLRYHTLSTLRSQTVGDHSAGIALLILAIVPAYLPERRARLLTAALVHDLAEHRVGDIPSPGKRLMTPEACAEFNRVEDETLSAGGWPMPPLSVGELRILKICDVAEGALFCCEERMRGNLYAREAFNNYWHYLVHELYLAAGDKPQPWETELSSHIITEWQLANGAEL